MTRALIVVFAEPQTEDVAETVLGQIEMLDVDDSGGEVIGFHVEHATVQRCEQLIEEIEQPQAPTIDEASAVMSALAEYGQKRHGIEPMARDMKSLLGELAGAIRRLRRVTR